ncbi:crossover junction endodeoxyribonuclease RuvC [soil metagenome]
MKVMGIDPGTATTGYAVVERRSAGASALDVGVVCTDSSSPQAVRLVELRRRLTAVMAAHEPEIVAVERVFFNSNVRTAMAVGQAAGIALVTAAEAGIPVVDLTPLEVKQSVVGVGSASKHQVGAMVARILGLERAPSPPDAADACALAICCLNRSRLAGAIQAARR